MKTNLLFPAFGLAVLVAACQTELPEPTVVTDSAEEDTTEVVTSRFIPTDSIDSMFARRNAVGTLVLYDEVTNAYQHSNPMRADEPLLPASTYKIINSMIALEEGAVSNVDEVIPWDGQVRNNPAWNKDMTMREGIQVSCVWFYQELARRIGEERMQYWVDTCDYGNRNISGGIDLFWLIGGARITANQQIDFLRRLKHDELPFQPGTMDVVKEIMVVDSGDNYLIRAKTGWAMTDTEEYGWWVGWLENEDGNLYFALNLDISEDHHGRARKDIVYEVLQAMELVPVEGE